MTLRQEGSRHEWLNGQPALDLIVTSDDATGEIYSAFLVAEEGPHSTLRTLHEVISQLREKRLNVILAYPAPQVTKLHSIRQCRRASSPTLRPEVDGRGRI